MVQMEKVTPVTSDELLNAEYPLREFILLIGKDNSGKTCAIVSLAWYLEQVSSGSKFYVIDTENKFKAAMRSFGAEAPRNVVYYKCDCMNHANYAVNEVLHKFKPGDWLAVESGGRVWEYAQDLATRAIAGVSKAEYLDMEVGDKTATGVERKKSPIPDPDQYWNIAKGAHDGGFFYRLTANEKLNIIVSTTITKPPKSDLGKSRENVDRKALRLETGVDFNMDGAPKLPTWAETLAVMELQRGNVSCRIVRDNLTALEDGKIDFEVPSRKEWAVQFYSSCRR